MTDYRHMARRLLQDNRPKELKGMRSEGRLETFLDKIQGDYSQRELDAVHRTIKGLPPEMPYQERVLETETTKRQIQEFLVAELRDLLSRSPRRRTPGLPERLLPAKSEPNTAATPVS